MFENINKILKIDSRPLEDLGFVHISGNAQGNGVANSSFLVHHFLSYFLKNSCKVCLVSCSQTLTQYKIVQGKLGVNVDKAISEAKLTFISALSLLGSQASMLLTSMSPQSCGDGSESTTDLISTILDGVREKMSLIQAEGPCLLILDDLTALHDIGVTTSDILQMVCKLKTSFPCVSTILTTSLRLDPSVAEEESLSLDNQLSHWAELLFYVDELTTGVSKDVHGQIRVRRVGRLLSGNNNVDTYHYKATDRDVKLFAVGASPAVL